MHWIAALLYWPFGEHAVIGRLISMAFSVGTIWAIYALGARLFGRRGGSRRRLSLRDFAERGLLRPLLHLRHADGLLLGGGGPRVGRVSGQPSRAACLAGTICAALAFLVKIPAVMILVPIAWAAWEARGWSALKDRGLVGWDCRRRSLATGLWYWHADAIYHRTGLSQAIWHPSGNYGPPISGAAGPFIGIYHWATAARLKDPAFYDEMLTRTWALHLTPAGFVLAVFALLDDLAHAAPRICSTPGWRSCCSSSW